MSALVAAVGGLLGYIASLALIAWAEHCEPNVASCSLGGAAGLTIALLVAVVAAFGLGRLTWKRLGRFSARTKTRAE